MSGIKGLSALKAFLLTDVPKEIESAGREAIVDTMLEGQSMIKKELNERKIWDTGNLARSVLIDRSQLSQLKGRIYATADYAAHVNLGHVVVRGGKVVGYVEGRQYTKNTHDQIPAILSKNITRSLGRRL